MSLSAGVTNTCDFFGFLPLKDAIVFNGGRITPLDDFDEQLKAVEEATNADGYLYPPITRQVTVCDEDRIDRDTGKLLPESDLKWVDVPKTKRPALLHRLPPSHKLELQKSVKNGSLREEDGAFLLHLVGYLLGHRLQFFDWWFDRRIRMKSFSDFFARPPDRSNFIGHAYSTWRTWPQETRRRFTNLLYMLARSETYEWDWERFTINYMVLDACWKVSEELYGLSAKTHGGRLEVLCNHFNLHYDAVKIKEIVDLRNDLFHETLWAGQMPCNGGSNEVSSLCRNLQSINLRLIPALLHYPTGYIGSNWQSRSMSIF